jgi:putative phage-type endonuclease
MIDFTKNCRVGMTHDEWLNIRQRYITATEAGVICGINPYTTASQLLKEKKLPPVSIPDNKFMMRGREWEDRVLDQAATWLGADLIKFKDICPQVKDGAKEQFFFYNDEHRISATPDGILSDGRLIEVKTTGMQKVNSWIPAKGVRYEKNEPMPPAYYIMQCHVQMYVTGAKTNYLMARFFYNWPEEGCEPGMDKMWEVNYNPEIIALLQNQVKKFWTAFENNGTIRVSTALKEKLLILLKQSIKHFQGEILMEKTNVELDPRQRDIMLITAMKAAAKMCKADPIQTRELASCIMDEVVQNACNTLNNGDRDTLIKLGACINGFIEAAPETDRTVSNMLLFVSNVMFSVNVRTIKANSLKV